MIKVTIKRAALKRGIKNPYRLAQKLEGTDTEPSARAQILAGALWYGRNEPTLATIDRVAKALECDLSELLLRKANRRKKSVPPNGSQSNGRK